MRSIVNGTLWKLLVTTATVFGLTQAASGQCQADGVGEDCNNNGILDACELVESASYNSGSLAPIDRLRPQSFTIDNPSMSLSDVTLTVSSRGDYSHYSEIIFVSLNGSEIGKLFFIGNDCYSVFTEQVVVPMAIYNQEAATGSIQIDMIASSTVSVNVCPTSFIQVLVDVSVSSAADADGNGKLDECESASCDGLQATIFVDDNGFVVGGPLDGVPYFGVLIGTKGDDVIVGTDGPDHIVAGKGDDVICAGDGDDHINANHGDDIINAGNGRDKVHGGGGYDLCLDGEMVKGCEG